MTPPNGMVWAGIDTHTDTHTIALLDERGRPLGSETFAANPDGYDRLIDMLPGPGAVAAVGVEGTNSFGATLARRLAAAGYEVREVLRPKRNVRRRNGKSDPIDAVAAARSVMAGDDAGPPKSSDGWVEALRHLNAQRAQLVSAMTAISNSTNGLLVTAPEPVRERYRGLKGGARMNRLAECRPAGGLVEHSALVALKSAAKAWKALKRQSGLLEERMRAILEEHARPLLDMYCVGTVIAAALAIVAGDNPERIRSEAAFAKLCGACPLPASSGRTSRHRLNKGGNRAGQRGAAPHRHRPPAIPPTHQGLRRQEDPRGQRQARDHPLRQTVHRPRGVPALIAIRNGGNGRGTSGERGARLRELRMNHGITQQQVGEALCVPSSRISEIERGRRDLPELEQRAIQWIHSITDPKQHAQTLDNV